MQTATTAVACTSISGASLTLRCWISIQSNHSLESKPTVKPFSFSEPRSKNMRLHQYMLPANYITRYRQRHRGTVCQASPMEKLTNSQLHCTYVRFWYIETWLTASRSRSFSTPYQSSHMQIFVLAQDSRPHNLTCAISRRGDTKYFCSLIMSKQTGRSGKSRRSLHGLWL